MNDELRKIWKEPIMVQHKNYPVISLEEMGKTMKTAVRKNGVSEEISTDHLSPSFKNMCRGLSLRRTAPCHYGGATISTRRVKGLILFAYSLNVQKSSLFSTLYNSK
jgi:hypothetical protein